MSRVETRPDEELFRRPSDWERLAKMRRAYLEVDAQPWADERDLALYHASFGERIRWKWHAVFAEPALRGLAPVPGHVVDFGCGSGVASLALIASGLAPQPADVHLVDASILARRFAARRLVEAGANVHAGGTPPAGPIGTLVASHVLTELGRSDENAFVALAARAQRVFIVEPGTRAVAQAVVALRERLRNEAGLTPLAPCPHAGVCGLAGAARRTLAADSKDSANSAGGVAEANDAQAIDAWCHHFATPAPEAFTSRFWREFGERLGIDLRALPMSFLVLERNAVNISALPNESEGEFVRILGRPRWEKGRSRFDLCHAGGVHAADMLKRTSPDLHRSLKEPEESVQLHRATLREQPDGSRRIESLH
jgi:hypothetical protein